jgi:hypothetical protein
MSKGNNFYKVLGVSRTASQAQIKKAYHKKSRDHHTDKHGSGATEKMQQINHAHEIFSDPESRKRYDMTGEDPSIRQPRNKQPFGSASDSGPGYCASCDNDPCACFIFKPAGSSKPSHSHSPTTCWECHQDLAGVKNIKLSCGCCAWCFKCADRAFQTTPDQTQKTLHQEIRVTFEEAQDILSRDVWHACNVACRAVCYWCKVPAEDFVVGLCRNHLWCRKCFVSIYIVATKDSHCCHAMVGHRIVKDHLPEPVAAYFYFKRRCKFQIWREQEQAEALMGGVRDWQEKHREMIYGEAASRALEQKDVTIGNLEAKLKAAAAVVAQKEAMINDKLKASAEAHPQQPGKEVPGQSESNLKDELVRKNMRIKQLEKSNNLLKQANIQEIAKFSAARKARKIASDNEAAVKKENEELKTQLATARSQLREQQSTAPRAEAERKGSRHNIQDELVAAQEAHKSASNSNATAQKRLKELEAESSTLRQDIMNQKQEFVNSNDKLRAALAEAHATQKVANDNQAIAETQIKDLTIELQQQNQAFVDKQTQTATAQAADKAVTEKKVTAWKQVEELKAQLTDAGAKCLTAETSVTSLQNRIAWLETEMTVPQEQRRCHDCGTKPLHISERAAITSSQAQTSQNKTAEPSVDPSESKPKYQATVADDVDSPSAKSTAKAADHIPKPNSNVTLTTSIKSVNNNSDAAASGHNNQQPSAAPEANSKSETPTSLLRAQLQYARATQQAAENMSKVATDKYFDLYDEVRKYKIFEIDVPNEFARANKMYLSLLGEYNWAMDQLSQIKHYAQDATIKIPADQFANDIDDTSRTTTEVLATLTQQFEPVRAKLGKPQASQTTKKPRKMKEAPLQIAARRNRKLRDIIRQREQEIANVRIHYGQKWAKILDNVTERDTEIRQLKRRLHLRESRSNSDASIGAGEVAPLSEKDEQIKSLKTRADILRWENTGKEQKIAVLDKQAKDLEELKLRNAKLRFDLNEVIRQKKNISKDVERRTST